MPSLSLNKLASEQSIQKLLPILRLKPRKLIHLVTSRKADRSAVFAVGGAG